MQLGKRSSYRGLLRASLPLCIVSCQEAAFFCLQASPLLLPGGQLVSVDREVCLNTASCQPPALQFTGWFTATPCLPAAACLTLTWFGTASCHAAAAPQPAGCSGR